MLQFTLRQIKILDHLLQSEVSFIDDLLSYAKISSRTLQSEIATINQELEHHAIDIVIKPNRGRGYCAEPNQENRVVFEELKRQCQTYLNHELTLAYGDNPRIACLIRKFLCADGYVKAEELQEEFHISMATLTNDLRLVRPILESYEMQLQSTPYYGMRLIADPFALRCALIDFCDIYDLYTFPYYFEVFAFSQYHIDATTLIEARKQLNRILQEHQVHLQEQGFARIFFYLLILKNNAIPQSIPKMSNWMGSIYQDCANALLDAFAICDSQEQMFLELLLLIHQEPKDQKVLHQVSMFSQITSLLGNLLAFLQEEIHLDLGRKVHIVAVLRSYLERYLWKRQYHLHFFNHHQNLRRIIRDIPVSASLSYQMLEYLSQVHGLPYDSDDLIACVIPLFNAIFLVPNEYRMVHIAFLGSFSESTTASIGYRMSMDERHNIHRDYYSFYEVDTIDLSHYDCVFVVDSGGIRLPQTCDASIFYVDYFYHYEKSNEFFEQVMARFRVDNFLIDKIDQKISFLVSDLKEVLQTLATYGYHGESGEALLHQLMLDNAMFYQNDPLVICLLWKEELPYTLFLFEFTEALHLQEHEIHQLQIVILDPKDNVLAVKQADSYIRRMQHSCVL